MPFAEEKGAGTVDMEIICCPEDRRCMRKSCRARRKTVCVDCEVPICNECEESLQRSGNIFTDMDKGFWPLHVRYQMN